MFFSLLFQVRSNTPRNKQTLQFFLFLHSNKRIARRYRTHRQGVQARRSHPRNSDKTVSTCSSSRYCTFFNYLLHSFQCFIARPHIQAFSQIFPHTRHKILDKSRKIRYNLSVCYYYIGFPKYCQDIFRIS